MPPILTTAMLTTSQQAFSDSAGITPSQLQSAISIALLTGILIWAAWIIISTLGEVHESHFTFITLIRRVLGVLLIVSLCIVLVH